MSMDLKRAWRLAFVPCSAIALVGLAAAPPASADEGQSYWWINEDGGQFDVSSNWEDANENNAVPGEDDTIVFDLDATYTVTFPEPDFSYQQVSRALHVQNGEVELAGPLVSWDGIYLNITEEVVVGLQSDDTARLDLRGHGMVSGGSVHLGQAAGSSGTLTLDTDEVSPSSHPSLLVGSDLYVGEAGTGTLEVFNQSAVSNNDAFIGFDEGSVGTVSLTNSTSWDTAGSLYIGGSETQAGGTGTVNVGGSADVDVANSTLVWDDGTLNLTGGSFTTDGGVSHGHLGIGGGTFTTTDTFVSHGSIDVDGGSLEGSFQIQNTGGVTITGNTSFNELNGNGEFFDHGGQMTVASGATATFNVPVSGAGNFDGQGTVVFNADYSPGNSIASVSFGGNAAFGSNNTLLLELAGTDDYDHLDIAGQLTPGGTLQLELIDGFEADSIATFNLFNFTSLTDEATFDQVLLPEPKGNLQWDTDALYTAGTVSLVPEPGTLGLLSLGGLLLLRRRTRAA